MNLVRCSRTTRFRNVLQLELDIRQHFAVEQLAQLFGPEEVVEQVAIQRQGRSPTLGQRGIPFVHVRSNPVEEQALCKR